VGSLKTSLKDERGEGMGGEEGQEKRWGDCGR